MTSNKKRNNKEEKSSAEEWTDKIIIPFQDEWSEPSHE